MHKVLHYMQKVATEIVTASVKDMFRNVNNFTDADIEEVVNTLKKESCITTLDLSCSNINSAGTKNLAAILEQNDTITNLNLRNNQLGDSSLSHERSEGVKAFAKMLKINNKINSLDLSSCTFGVGGFEEIVGALKFNTSIDTLKLNFCCNIGLFTSAKVSTGVKAIVELIEVNSTINNLEFISNIINYNEIKAITDALKINTSIVSLDLSCNNIDSSNKIEAIIEMLKINNAIAKLNLRGNQVDINAIAKLIKANTTITSLDLSNNDICDDNIHSITDALKSNIFINNIDFSASRSILNFNSKRIIGAGIKAIAEMLETNNVLTNIEFDSHGFNLGFHLLSSWDEGRDKMKKLLYRNQELWELHNTAKGNTKGLYLAFNEHMSEINKQHPSGRTPLHFAFIANDLAKAKLLIQEGASLEIEDLKGKKALDYLYGEKSLTALLDGLNSEEQLKKIAEAIFANEKSSSEEEMIDFSWQYKKSQTYQIIRYIQQFAENNKHNECKETMKAVFVHLFHLIGVFKDLAKNQLPDNVQKNASENLCMCIDSLTPILCKLSGYNSEDEEISNIMCSLLVEDLINQYGRKTTLASVISGIIKHKILPSVQEIDSQQPCKAVEPLDNYHCLHSAESLRKTSELIFVNESFSSQEEMIDFSWQYKKSQIYQIIRNIQQFAENNKYEECEKILKAACIRLFHLIGLFKGLSQNQLPDDVQKNVRENLCVCIDYLAPILFKLSANNSEDEEINRIVYALLVEGSINQQGNETTLASAIAGIIKNNLLSSASISVTPEFSEKPNDENIQPACRTTRKLSM